MIANHGWAAARRRGIGAGLPAKYRSQGLRFTDEGYPDFTPYAKELPNGKHSVQIELTGRRRPDIELANKAATLDPPRTPAGYIWHHHQDGKTMMLVPEDLHSKLAHTGGRAHCKHVTGDVTAYPD